MLFEEENRLQNDLTEKLTSLALFISLPFGLDIPSEKTACSSCNIGKIHLPLMTRFEICL